MDKTAIEQAIEKLLKERFVREEWSESYNSGFNDAIKEAIAFIQSELPTERKQIEEAHYSGQQNVEFTLNDIRPSKKSASQYFDNTFKK